MTTTATLREQAASAQLLRIINALDARLQQARGHESHVPLPTDAELRQMAELALGHLGGAV